MVSKSSSLEGSLVFKSASTRNTNIFLIVLLLNDVFHKSDPVKVTVSSQFIRGKSNIETTENTTVRPSFVSCVNQLVPFFIFSAYASSFIAILHWFD